MPKTEMIPKRRKEYCHILLAEEREEEKGRNPIRGGRRRRDAAISAGPQLMEKKRGEKNPALLMMAWIRSL